MKRARKPTFISLAQATAEFGYSKSTLLRYIDQGLPLTGKALESDKDERATTGCVPRRELVVVSREQLAGERAREANLDTGGFNEPEARKAWGISAKTLRKRVKEGKVLRTPATIIRPKTGKGIEFRYKLAAPLPLKPPPLQKAKRRITVNNEQHLSTRETARTLGVAESDVLLHAKKRRWHGIRFVPHCEGEAFYFSSSKVNDIRTVRQRAAKAGWRGAGPLPPQAAHEGIKIDDVPFQGAIYLAQRLGVKLSTITGPWAKGCPYYDGKILRLEYRRRKPLLPVEQAAGIEKNFRERKAAGWAGVGRPPAQSAAFQMVAGEWCILVREAARQLGTKSKSIRQWKDRANAPGLSEPLRLHSKARCWSYMPVSQFRRVAEATGVTPNAPDHATREAPAQSRASSSNEARDRFIFESRQKGVTWKEIMTEGARKWAADFPDSQAGCWAAASRYAERHDLTLQKGKRGRGKKAR